MLIARRRAGDYYGGWWEFPGGKRRPAETYEQTLHRELDEELGIRVRVLGELAQVDHDYGDRTVHLVFFLCEHAEGEPQAIHCEEPRWVAVDALTEYEFPAANAGVIQKLLAERGVGA